MNKTKRTFLIMVIALLTVTCVAVFFPASANAYAMSGKAKAPAITSLKKADNGFRVISGNNSKVKGFQIKYSTSIRFKNSKYKRVNGNKLDATVSGLKEYKKYYVKIRSYKIVKGKRKYSEWSKRKRIITSCKPFDKYYAYTRYAQTTLYKSRTLFSGKIVLWYNTKVYVAGVRKIAGVRWIKVFYKGKRYYIPAKNLSEKLKKSGSQYIYFGRTDLENEFIANAMEVYLHMPTKYDYTHKALMGVSDSKGRYPFDCSALVSYLLNRTMQKYCPAYKVSRGDVEEYYTQGIVNGGFEGAEFSAVTVCTGKPSLSKLRAGDVLFFRQSYGYPIDHVGLYLGNGEFIQSNGIYSRYPGDSLGGVNIAPLTGVYKTAFVAARRFLPLSPEKIATLNKVLVRKTGVTVYGNVLCATGNEIDYINLPEGQKQMELKILYTGNRYYKVDKVTSRCAMIEYENAAGEKAFGFVRITDKSVIRDPLPVESAANTDQFADPEQTEPLVE